VGNDCASDLDLYLPQATFDQVVTAFRAMNESPEGRLRPLIDAQCGPLSMVLKQDVMGIVYEYLFVQLNGGDGSRQSSEETRNW